MLAHTISASDRKQDRLNIAKHLMDVNTQLQQKELSDTNHRDHHYHISDAKLSSDIKLSIDPHSYHYEANCVECPYSSKHLVAYPIQCIVHKVDISYAPMSTFAAPWVLMSAISYI